MNPRYRIRHVAWGCRLLRWHLRMRVQGSRSQTTVEEGPVGQIEMIDDVIGVPWRLPDGRWTVDRLEVTVEPVPPIKDMERDHARIQTHVATELNQALKQHHTEQHGCNKRTAGKIIGEK